MRVGLTGRVGLTNAIGTAAIVLAALVYILRFAVPWPVVDEWDLTQVVLGGMTLSEWTFTRLNEHLFIPGNALWYVTMKLSGLNFRAGMLVNLSLHTLAALVAMNAAKRIRGEASIADLFLPAVLLNWGHAYNLTMSYQIVFGLFLLAASIMLWVIATAEADAKSARRAALALLFLMLNGGMGLAFVPPLGLWIAWLAWRSRSAWAFALLTLAAGYTAFAIFGAPTVSAAPKQALPVSQLAWCVAQYLGMGLGLWYDGPHWPRNGVIVAGAYAITMVGLIVSVVINPRLRVGLTRRLSRVGFAAFLLGHLAVAVGIAVSRGGGIAERYVTISAIGLVAAYLAHLKGERRGVSPPSQSSVTVDKVLHFDSAGLRRAARLLPTVLIIAINIGPGLRYGKQHRAIYAGLESDLANGVRTDTLVARHAAKLRVGDNLGPALMRLHDHGVITMPASSPRE